MVAVGFNPRFRLRHLIFVAEQRLNPANNMNRDRRRIIAAIVAPRRIFFSLINRGLKPTATIVRRSATRREDLTPAWSEISLNVGKAARLPQKNRRAAYSTYRRP